MLLIPGALIGLIGLHMYLVTRLGARVPRVYVGLDEGGNA